MFVATEVGGLSLTLRVQRRGNLEGVDDLLQRFLQCLVLVLRTHSGDGEQATDASVVSHPYSADEMLVKIFRGTLNGVLQVILISFVLGVQYVRKLFGANLRLRTCLFVRSRVQTNTLRQTLE